MAEIIRFYQTGDENQLVYERGVAIPEPKGREVLIRHTAIGVNYIDVYYRSGLYGVPSLPSCLGVEAVGVIEAVGDAVQYYMVGDRVGYCKGGLGAYASHRVLDETNLVMLPPEIEDDAAAAVLLKGNTAHYLLRKTIAVSEGANVLVQAGAGGTGLILCQWAKALGATVITTVGTREKEAVVRDAGADHVIFYKEQDVAQTVMDVTEGRKCHVVYDGVGKDTFFSSLDCLMPFGLMVSFGQSSGAIPDFNITELSKRGSLFLTRPSLFDYKKDFSDYVHGCEELFVMVVAGHIKPLIGGRYALKDAAQAHRDLASRKTIGSLVLYP